VGAGFALAAKLTRPDETVVILYGDGSCGYGLVEFDTFVRMKTPVIAVVGNDACWSQVGTKLRPAGPRLRGELSCSSELGC
jgi:thiamine pyrophosphate-dependent acetolactate synthase large subunit-like protein